MVINHVEFFHLTTDLVRTSLIVHESKIEGENINIASFIHIHKTIMVCAFWFVSKEKKKKESEG